MTQIAAAENLTIQADAMEWRLIARDDLNNERELLRAVPDEPLTFSADFALKRRLPSAGRLPVKYVQTVVLGWSHQDEAWHLGLVLVAELAEIRGSRWCEIASWPEPDPNVFLTLARQSGEVLAGILHLPFRVVQPRHEARLQPETPLPPLPIDLGTWQIKPMKGDAVELKRTRRWYNGRYLRIFWYGLLSAVYIALSVATLQSNLALPNSGLMLPSPELLPYLGVGAAIISAGIALYSAYEALFRPNRVVLDGHGVARLRGARAQWELPSEAVKAIYVTHILQRKRRGAVIEHGEINLHTQDGKFYRLIQQAERDNEVLLSIGAGERIEDDVMPLKPHAEVSDLQAAALHMARALGGLPCWYDQREK